MMARLVGSPVGGGGVSGVLRVEGASELIAKLQRMQAFARLEMGYVTYQTAKIVEGLAQGMVPVETGNLKSGIKTLKLGSYTWSVSASSLEGSVGEKNNKEYAHFVEYGTSRMSPRPFMRPAFSQGVMAANLKLRALGQRLVSL